MVSLIGQSLNLSLIIETPTADRGTLTARNHHMGRMMKLGAKLCTLLVGGLALAAPAASAQVGANDSGTFEVQIGGRTVGTEEFQITQSGAGSGAEIVATGRVNLVVPTGTIDLITRLETSGFQAQPVSYEVTVGGSSPRKIVGTIGNGRFSARIATPSGEQMREYVASSGATVLDDGVAHHYYFLARRMRNGRIPIIIPRENRQVMATVRDAGLENVEIRETTVPLYHLEVLPDGGDIRHVWVDDLGRVIRVEIPARSYVALRTELPE